MTLLVPILFSVSFVLSLFLQNINELPFKRLTAPLSLSIGFAIIVWLISSVLFRNKAKKEFYSTIFLILFFSYGAVLSLLGKIPISWLSKFIAQNQILFPVWIISLFLLYFFIKSVTWNFEKINGAFKKIALITLLITAFGILNYQLRQRWHPSITSPSSLPTNHMSKNQITAYPDIYFILPEEYTSSSAFKKYYNADLSDFEKYLQTKGFYIASESTSNYPKTFLSVASLLNMEYVDYLSIYKNSSDTEVVTPLIKVNNVLRFLKSQGYKYYQMGSWWGPLNFNSLADDNFILEGKNRINVKGFTYVVLESTMLNPIIKNWFPQIIIGRSFEDKRESVIYQFEKLPEVAILPGPKFVFVQIMAPHTPYALDHECNFLTEEEIQKLSEEVNYVRLTQCVNKKLEDVIDKILKVSSRPPVILLQSDEGAEFFS